MSGNVGIQDEWSVFTVLALNQHPTWATTSHSVCVLPGEPELPVGAPGGTGTGSVHSAILFQGAGLVLISLSYCSPPAALGLAPGHKLPKMRAATMP